MNSRKDQLLAVGILNPRGQIYLKIKIKKETLKEVTRMRVVFCEELSKIHCEELLDAISKEKKIVKPY